MNHPGQFKPMERGPQTGAPPSLEFVSLDRLQVDPAYQRATAGPHSRKIIRGMVKEWKWPLCQPLVVVRRDDGTLWILDGQHRHSGALERGDIAHLPCVVLPAIGATEEARAFVDLNTKRQRLSQADIFHGMLAAGDEHAKKTAVLLEETGWRLVRSDNTQGFSPGDLTCAPSVAAQLKAHGENAVRQSLCTLRQAYPDEAVTAPAKLIQALVQIYRKDSDHRDEMPRLVRAMTPVSAAAWLPRADRRRLADPTLSQIQAVALVLLEAAGLKKATTPPPSPRPLPPRPAAAPAAHLGLFAGGDRAWCSQCEQRVDRDKAAACESPFCKVKAAAA